MNWKINLYILLKEKKEILIIKKMIFLMNWNNSIIYRMKRKIQNKLLKLNK
jgi:hypothetical protein